MSPVWNVQAMHWECVPDPHDLDDPKVQRRVLAFAWALFFLIVAGAIAGIRCACTPEIATEGAPP